MIGIDSNDLIAKVVSNKLNDVINFIKIVVISQWPQIEQTVEWRFLRHLRLNLWERQITLFQRDPARPGTSTLFSICSDLDMGWYTSQPIPKKSLELIRDEFGASIMKIKPMLQQASETSLETLFPVCTSLEVPSWHEISEARLRLQRTGVSCSNDSTSG